MGVLTLMIIVSSILRGGSVENDNHTGFSSEQPVIMTAYNAVVWQTDSTPKISACGPNLKNQIAVSRDLLKRFPCGTKVEIYRPDTKRWHATTVWDTMHSSKKNQIDILMKSYVRARQFGHWKTGGLIRKQR